VTRPLIALGHRVTAVDESPAMLAELRGTDGVEVIEARIEALDLDRTWPVVVLGSHFVNAGRDVLDPILRAVRRHLSEDGILLAEAYPPELDWAAAVRRRSHLGPVAVTITQASVVDGQLSAVVRYEIDGQVFDQGFIAVLRDETALAAELARNFFRFDGWLDRDRGWFRAVGSDH
jgi:SAM-dependent methyltransferase